LPAASTSALNRTGCLELGMLGISARHRRTSSSMSCDESLTMMSRWSLARQPRLYISLKSLEAGVVVVAVGRIAAVGLRGSGCNPIEFRPIG